MILNNNAKELPGKPEKKENFAPLKHKNGTKLNDVEYMILLGEQIEEMNDAGEDAEERYGRQVCEVAKIVKDEYEKGTSLGEIQTYLKRCVEVN